MKAKPSHKSFYFFSSLYMDGQNYHATITANVSAKEALENISRVSEWWVTNCEGNAKNLNDVFTVRMGKNDRTFVTFKIIEVVPDKKVVWQVTDCFIDWDYDKKEWMDTKIVWEVSTKNNATQIDMTHVGLVPEVPCYEVCKKGWDFYVKESLLKLLTEHRGLPDKQRA